MNGYPPNKKVDPILKIIDDKRSRYKVAVAISEYVADIERKARIDEIQNLIQNAVSVGDIEHYYVKAVPTQMLEARLTELIKSDLEKEK